MDLSKLPKLSQTPKSDAPAEPAPGDSRACPACGLPLRAGAKFCDACGASIAQPLPVDRAGVGAEAWISIALAIILLILTPHTLTYVSSKLFHTTFAPYPDPTRPFPARCDFILYNDGTREYYRDRPEFWSDMAITILAAALIVEGITLILSRRRALMLFALSITVAATLLNLGYVIATTSKYGWPLMSLLAVVFGIYIGIQQWSHLRFSRR
jgi:zinc ribbon protein